MPTRAKIEHKHISACMKGLEEISHAWPVAKLVHTVFETILGGSTSELEVKSTKRRKLQTLKTERKAVPANASSHFRIKTEPTFEQPPRPEEQTFSYEVVSPSRVLPSAQGLHDSLATGTFEQDKPQMTHNTWDNPYSHSQIQPCNSRPFETYGPAREDWHINEAVFDALWDDNPFTAREPE